MATLTAPGVYIDEVSSGVRPIEAAGTSTAAFFGVAERGTIGEVKKIFSFTEFQNEYGGFLTDGHYLAHGVYQFFNNGGGSCYVGRVAEGEATARVTVLDRGDTPQNSLTFSASSPGVWGNRMMVVVDSDRAGDPANQFNIEVYRDHPDPDEDPVLMESFPNLSMNPDDPSYVETAVNNSSRYLRVAINAGNSNLIAGYSESAEIDLAGQLLGENQRQFRLNLHGDGYRTVDLTEQLEAFDPATLTLENIRGAIQNAIQALTPLRNSTPSDAYAVDVSIQNTNRLRIASGKAEAGSTVRVIDADDPFANAAGALRLGETEVYGSAPLRPQNTPDDDFYFLGDDTEEGAVATVEAGADGTEPQTQGYINALQWLDMIRDVSLLAVPGVGDPALADAGMNYCRNTRHLSDCFYIADMERDVQDLEGATIYRNDINTPNSYGAVYFPWLLMLDPTGRSPEPIQAPPSGYVAGLYAQIDGRRGVWKAPAGTEAMLAGAVGLVTHLTEAQHGDLNNHKKSVSVIRKFSGPGIVLWGTRTLSSDPEYKYTPVRRTAIMLRKSIFNGIQWAVFEPNDEPLWAALRLNIRTFMNTLFRKGVFQGATPSEAYFVKCDGETTTQADIDLGVVNVLVGFAPLKPAEFVVVKIQQIAGQAP